MRLPPKSQAIKRNAYSFFYPLGWNFWINQLGNLVTLSIVLDLSSIDLVFNTSHHTIQSGFWIHIFFVWNFWCCQNCACPFANYDVVWATPLHNFCCYGTHHHKRCFSFRVACHIIKKVMVNLGLDTQIEKHRKK